jgi:hypothetical protein
VNLGGRSDMELEYGEGLERENGGPAINDGTVGFRGRGAGRGFLLLSSAFLCLRSEGSESNPMKKGKVG